MNPSPVRSLAWIALAALAAACGAAATPEAGPLDVVYRPTGLAFHQGRLLAVSSNADLLYDDATGGAVLSIDPTGAGTTYGVNIPSFGGDLALADPAACGTAVPGPLAVTVTRGSNTLQAIQLDPATGRLSCWHCGVPLVGAFADPLAVAIACGPSRASAFVGYLRAPVGQGWLSEYDLAKNEIRSGSPGSGAVRGFAYDVERDRLYVVQLSTGSQTPLRWIDLGGTQADGSPCRLDRLRAEGGCGVGEAFVPTLGGGLELRAIALGPSSPGRRRAYLTARLYDLASAATAGGRTADLGGVLLVVDLVDDAFGGVGVELDRWEYIGRGAQDLRVLSRAGRPDVVAALAVDDGVLSIYDDETHRMRQFNDKNAAGAPQIGNRPFGLAIDDPDPVGTLAHVYVGSFGDSAIMPVDVPLDAPDASVAHTTVRITGAR